VAWGAARGVAICLPAVLVALFVAATTFPGGTAIPWQPVMVDLDVYRLAGSVLLDGGNFYRLPGPLQFLYPPVAALFAVPLAVLPAASVQIAWTVAAALMVVAILHRWDQRGWRLSLWSAAVVYAVLPVSQTLAFGQVGVLLVALVALDLAPGPRLLGGRRLLPEGVLTGVAAALKLTPMIFVLYLITVRRWRAALTTTISAAALTLLAAVILPRASVDFWTRLAHGDTGLGGSLIYYTNQSVYADLMRIFTRAPVGMVLGLLLSAGVVALGVWSAAVWHRAGEVRFAVVLCGVASLLASPVSWLHHFVWIVPLAFSLVEFVRRRSPVVPIWLIVLGWVFVGWVIISPYRRLPNGADLELTWSPGEHLAASTTAILGVTLLLAAALVGRRASSGKGSSLPAVSNPPSVPTR
ncbi:MAG: glycosyltransferase 87 family protein, partial [Microlunatus sp.]|nr:glycosyltransferase 87 family protein [Microlunatus sp.]